MRSTAAVLSCGVRFYPRTVTQQHEEAPEINRAIYLGSEGRFPDRQETGESPQEGDARKGRPHDTQEEGDQAA